MDVVDVIKSRRSIRNFKDEDVSRETWEDIINCGILSPSSKNRQPWYFVVLKKEKKDYVAQLMSDYHKQYGGKEEIIKQGVTSSVLATSNVIRQAPALILVFRPKEDGWIIPDSQSIGACVENMCLRATDLGLGSLWVRDTYCVSDKIEKTYNKQDMELACALVIGVSNHNPPQRPRNDISSIIEWYE